MLAAIAAHRHALLITALSELSVGLIAIGAALCACRRRLALISRKAAHTDVQDEEALGLVCGYADTEHRPAVAEQSVDACTCAALLRWALRALEGGDNNGERRVAARDWPAEGPLAAAIRLGQERVNTLGNIEQEAAATAPFPMTAVEESSARLKAILASELDAALADVRNAAHKPCPVIGDQHRGCVCCGADVPSSSGAQSATVDYGTGGANEALSRALGLAFDGMDSEPPTSAGSALHAIALQPILQPVDARAHEMSVPSGVPTAADTHGYDVRRCRTTGKLRNLCHCPECTAAAVGGMTGAGGRQVSAAELSSDAAWAERKRSERLSELHTVRQMVERPPSRQTPYHQSTPPEPTAAGRIYISPHLHLQTAAQHEPIGYCPVSEPCLLPDQCASTTATTLFGKCEADGGLRSTGVNVGECRNAPLSTARLVAGLVGRAALMRAASEGSSAEADIVESLSSAAGRANGAGGSTQTGLRKITAAEQSLLRHPARKA